MRPSSTMTEDANAMSVVARLTSGGGVTSGWIPYGFVRHHYLIVFPAFPKKADQASFSRPSSSRAASMTRAPATAAICASHRLWPEVAPVTTIT
jgi:hypothetical protein